MTLVCLSLQANYSVAGMAADKPHHATKHRQRFNKVIVMALYAANFYLHSYIHYFI